MTAADANLARYRPDSRDGFYESFFLRANHPARPLAFWIRYTLFSPRGRPDDSIGELWAIYFDGEKRTHVAVKREVPFARCGFDRSRFAVHVGEATLQSGRLIGSAESVPHAIAWDLRYRGDADPLLLLPQRAYDAPLPKAKSLVGLPFAAFSGALTVDGSTIDVADWVGSQNHNWGTRHTDWYAWGQVAGFDNAPDTFLEVATARMKIGPLWTPALTLLVLRHDGREIALNSIRQGLRSKAHVQYFDWQFQAADDRVRVAGHVHAPADAFVALRYLSPPGGTKYCLNSKIAACEIEMTSPQAGGSAPVKLSTATRAAFEILTDEADHGLVPRV